MPARRGRHHQPHAPRRLRARRHPDTALVLKVHASNYRMVGFVESTPVAELATLGAAGDGRRRLGPARRRHTVAAGAPPWLRDEPGVRQAVDAGAALVTFSGDKLLGGPQAGVIVGRADLVATSRATRCARGARRQDDARAARSRRARLPRRATRPRSRSGGWPRRRSTSCAPVPSGSPGRARPEVIDTEAVAGGGSLPGLDDPVGRDRASPPRPDALARRRCGSMTSIARIVDEGGVRPPHRRTRRRRRSLRGARACRASPCARRDRRARRPRQVVARARAHRHRPRPVRRGEGARAHHRPRVRVHRVPSRRRGRRSSTCPATCASSRTCSPGSVRSTWRCSWSRADEGWMPQSEEHLRLLELLGVARRGRAHQGRPRRRRHARARRARARRAPGTRRRSRTPPVVVCDSLSGAGSTTCAPRSSRVWRSAPPAATTTAPGSGSTACFAAGGGDRRHRHARRRVVARRRRARGRRAPAHGARPRDGDGPPPRRRAGPGDRVALNLVGIEHRRSSGATPSCAPASGPRRRPSTWPSCRTRASSCTPGPGCRPTWGPASTTPGSGSRRRRRLRASALQAPSRSRPATASCSATPVGSTVAGADVLDADPTATTRDALPRLGPVGERCSHRMRGSGSTRSAPSPGWARRVPPSWTS